MENRGTILPQRYVPHNFNTHRLSVLFAGKVDEDKCDNISPSSLVECFHILGKERRLLISLMALVLSPCTRMEKKDKHDVHLLTTITINRIQILRVIL